MSFNTTDSPISSAVTAGVVGPQLLVLLHQNREDFPYGTLRRPGHN